MIGTAVALNLLFGLPLWLGVVLTGLDTLLFLAIQYFGIRKLEAVIVLFLACTNRISPPSLPLLPLSPSFLQDLLYHSLSSLPFLLHKCVHFFVFFLRDKGGTTNVYTFSHEYTHIANAFIPQRVTVYHTVICGCFIVEMFLVSPDVGEVMTGFLPTLGKESVYTAISLIGAVVMPHNIYLHSALVQVYTLRLLCDCLYFVAV